MTHASFKAALFLSAGLVIGVSGGHQHVARYGALAGVHTSLFCFMTLVLASLSLPIQTLMMVAHGLVSPGLFLLVGLLYDRVHTKVLLYLSGLGAHMPLLVHDADVVRGGEHEAEPRVYPAARAADDQGTLKVAMKSC